MARKSGNGAAAGQEQLPIQPVEKPIICNPYDEPQDHWIYDKESGAASHAGMRRPASYWYKTERTGSAQLMLSGLAEEERDDLPLVNLLRDDVSRLREHDYKAWPKITRDLLQHWARPDRGRRLFFCQREAVETILYLFEFRIWKTKRLPFKPSVSDDDLVRLLAGTRPSFSLATQEFFPRLIDPSPEDSIVPLRRMAAKMATGSGKTVVMSMLISWAFCNRGQNEASAIFPNGVLICCPNLTVKERLQVLRPERPDNYYEQFDIVPVKYRPLLQAGKVLVTNWHRFAPESEHSENGKSYAVVNKGPETPDTFARRVLEDLYDRLPIMVLNDEGHHCWRPAPEPEGALTGEEKEEREEARVWLDGLDRINNCTANPAKQAGISVCVDMSATPFYLHGSGYPEGRPFPWIVTDFGLVLKRPRILEANDVIPYTQEEMVRIIAACDKIGLYSYERLRARAMVLLMRYEGIRISDVVTLSREHIQGNHLVKRAVKNAKLISVALHPEVQKALEALPRPKAAGADCQLYFTSENSSLRSSVKGAQRTLWAVFKIAKVPGAHPHRFRHTLASELLAKGATYEDIAGILADSPTTVRRHYAKRTPEYQTRQDRTLALVHGANSVTNLAQTDTPTVSC